MNLHGQSLRYIGPVFAAMLLSTACFEHTVPAVPPPQGSQVDVERLTTFSEPGSVVGELVYIPVYSSVFYQAGNREFHATVTLSIHNVNLTESIDVSAVAYFNTQGRQLREFVSEPIRLGPLATKQFVIPDGDKTGGTGANFIVKWESANQGIARPLVEAVMISTSSQQGLSLSSAGTVIKTLRRKHRSKAQ